MKQFATGTEFNKWIASNFPRTVEQQLAGIEPTEHEIAEELVRQGYTDLDNLTADGSRYDIDGHRNFTMTEEEEVN